MQLAEDSVDDSGGAVRVFVPRSGAGNLDIEVVGGAEGSREVRPPAAAPVGLKG